MRTSGLVLFISGLVIASCGEEAGKKEESTDAPKPTIGSPKPTIGSSGTTGGSGDSSSSGQPSSSAGGAEGPLDERLTEKWHGKAFTFERAETNPKENWVLIKRKCYLITREGNCRFKESDGTDIVAGVEKPREALSKDVYDFKCRLKLWSRTNGEFAVQVSPADAVGGRSNFDIIYVGPASITGDEAVLNSNDAGGLFKYTLKVGGCTFP